MNGSCAHKFQPRFDEYQGPFRGAAQQVATLQKAGITADAQYGYETSKTYVCDICVKCGMRIERPQSTES